MRLTFSEFGELLEKVERVRVGDMDRQLLPLHNMPHPWYQGLLRVLMHKYDKGQYRCFNSTDGTLQYLVSTALSPNIRRISTSAAVVSVSIEVEDGKAQSNFV